MKKLTLTLVLAITVPAVATAQERVLGDTGAGVNERAVTASVSVDSAANAVSPLPVVRRLDRRAISRERRDLRRSRAYYRRVVERRRVIERRRVRRVLIRRETSPRGW